MKLVSRNFTDGQNIPGDFALAVPDALHHVALSKNHNPHLAWSDVPNGTRSFALVCIDKDVPCRGDDVNREGHSVSATLPRVDFFHWAIIGLPASLCEIAEGEFSHEVTPRGKSGPQAPRGARQAINDYTGWFADDNDMRGDYYGYDGPCPAWNDEIPHRYVFTLYALDTDLSLDGRFDGPAVLAALQGHVLAEASLSGRYSLNPALA